MSLSDCEKCWETPCCCGHDYKDWSTKRLMEFRDMFQKIIDERKQNGEKSIS